MEPVVQYMLARALAGVGSRKPLGAAVVVASLSTANRRHRKRPDRKKCHTLRMYAHAPAATPADAKCGPLQLDKFATRQAAHIRDAPLFIFSVNGFTPQNTHLAPPLLPHPLIRR